jgi:hypothetical protein
LDFGRRSDAEAAFSPQNLVVTSAAPLSRFEVSSHSPQIITVTKADGDRTRFVVEVTIVNSTAPEIVGGVVALNAELVTGEKITRAVSVSAQFVKDIQTSPPSFFLGARRLGETVEEPITLFSYSERPIDLVDKRVEGDGLMAEEISWSDKNHRTFQLRQRIQKSGNQEGQVVFTVKSERGQVSQIIVPVKYVGIEQ